MINLSNTQFLSETQRKAILKRAIYSEPFFHFFEFNLTAKAIRQKGFSSAAAINKDFFVTEIKSNFSDIKAIAGTDFKLSIYNSFRDESLLKYYKSILLPSSLQSTEARFNTAYANQQFDDRQREILPYKILKGNQILVNLVNDSAITDTAIGRIVIAGYYPNANAYISSESQRGINESLALPVKLEYWTQFNNNESEINTNTDASYTFTNDRFARLILGFGVVDENGTFTDLSESKVLISDSFRGLKWNDTPIPIEFLAPRLVSVRDTHIYYLPIEYFWQPFAPLKFEFFNTTQSGTPNNYQLVMLTRLV